MIRRKNIDLFNATAELCYVNVTLSNRGRDKYLIELQANGESYPIRFSSTDQVMLYLATLVYSARNSALEKKAFSRRKGLNSAEICLFRTLFRKVKSNGDFNVWFAKAIDKEAHRIHDAKSKVNRAIEEVLIDNHPEICEHFKIVPVNSRTNQSCYRVNIPAENIYICNDWGEL